MRPHFPCWVVRGLALVALLASGQQASAAPRPDPNARLGLLNCQAGEIAKFDGTRWVCAQDETADGAPAFVIQDAEGKTVGDVVDVINISSVQAIVALPHPISGEEITILLSFTPDGVGSGMRLIFQTLDCTGMPWIAFGPLRFFNVFTPSVVTGDGDLYVAVDDNLVQDFLIGSQLFGDTCRTGDGIERANQAVEAVLVDPNFYEAFPPPYTLEPRDR